MNRFGKYIKSAFKVLFISGVTISTASYGYLQYVNSIIGPLNINQDEAIAYYKKQFKYEEA